MSKIPDRNVLADIVEAVGGGGIFSVANHLPKIPNHFLIAKSVVDVLDWEHPEIWGRLKAVLKERHEYHSERAAKAAALLQTVEQFQENSGE